MNGNSELMWKSRIGRKILQCNGLAKNTLLTKLRRSIANKLENIYNKGSSLENIKEYEKDLNGLDKYREKVPNAE